MSNADRSVVVEYLLQSGWEEADNGPAGELWSRGSAEMLVPYEVREDSPKWRRMAVALAQADQVSPDDLIRRWDSALGARREREAEQGSRVREIPGQVELELHLDGPSVRDHQTPAYIFGRFVMRTADSVKELVKSKIGAMHFPRELLIAGGPAEGSVRVTFREPDRSDALSLVPDAPETAEGQALAFVADAFGLAEMSTGDFERSGELRESLAPLHVNARLGLARLAETIVEGGWVIDGVIRRGSEERPLHLSVAAARILRAISREELEEESVERVSGTLDGWRWSLTRLTLISDDGRSIPILVPPPLQTIVAELTAQPDTHVETELLVQRRLVRDSGDALRSFYTLRRIEPGYGFLS